MNINWKILGLSILEVVKYLALYSLVVWLLITLLHHLNLETGVALILIACTAALTYFEYNSRIKKN